MDKHSQIVEVLKKSQEFLKLLKCPRSKEIANEIESLLEDFSTKCPIAQCPNKECPCGPSCGIECCKLGCECERKGDAE